MKLMVQIAKNIRNKAIVEDNSFRTKYHNRVCSTSAIAVSISSQHGLIISNPKRKRSLMRIEDRIANQIQAPIYRLSTWSFIV
jgi:hypothetical protein